ncbi:MAG: hypothetical protein JWQ08_1975 [Deinococcus sp.]|nr:hypothetical protein [Deinococcus sp.]
MKNTRGLQRVQLPEDLIACAVTDTNGTCLIVSAGAEKGIRFHFHEDTARAVREAFLTRCKSRGKAPG